MSACVHIFTYIGDFVLAAVGFDEPYKLGTGQVSCQLTLKDCRVTQQWREQPRAARLKEASCHLQRTPQQSPEKALVGEPPDKAGGGRAFLVRRGVWGLRGFYPRLPAPLK